MRGRSNANGTVGQQSPRWAFMSRFAIPCPSGEMYLFRLRIVQTPWFSVYLHDVFEADGDRDPHDHPWSFVSIILRGGYVERVYPDPAGRPDHYATKRWRRFSAHRMGRDTAHRIIHATDGLKTLVLTGPRRGGWGFHVDGLFVPWQEYVEERDLGAGE